MATANGLEPGDTAAVGAGLTGTTLLAGGGETLAAAGVVGLEMTNPIGWALLGGSIIYFGWRALQHANQQADDKGGDQPATGTCNCPTDRPYAHIPDGPAVGPGKPFTPAQKKKILQENQDRNGGELRGDDNGEPLVPSSKSTSGVTPPANEAQVDHIDPRNPADPNATPGTNSYGNAQVISRGNNRAKSNN